MSTPQPTDRATAMMHAIAAIMSLPVSAQQIELSKLGSYTSRGKGRGKDATGIAAKALHVGRSKYRPHQGTGEIARRQGQIAKGMLSPVYAS